MGVCESARPNATHFVDGNLSNELIQSQLFGNCAGVAVCKTAGRNASQLSARLGPGNDVTKPVLQKTCWKSEPNVKNTRRFSLPFPFLLLDLDDLCSFIHGSTPMFEFLRRWCHGSSRVPQNTTTVRKNQFRPRLEMLEDRFAPAVFNVNSTADILKPAAGVVTLRSAIEAANDTPGGNTINLTVPGTYSITLPGTPGEVNNAAGEFAISAAGGNLTIQNTSNGTVIVNGNHLVRVFDINPLFTVETAVVTAVGSGFTSAPKVTLTGGGGTGATATAAIADGQVVSVTITNAGSGYTSAPIITFSGGGGKGAAATAIVASPKISVTFIGFTIENGLANGGNVPAGAGGGIRDNDNANLTLTNVVVTNNTASADGGGVSMADPLTPPGPDPQQ